MILQTCYQYKVDIISYCDIIYVYFPKEEPILIEVKNLTKVYGNHTAVNNVSFTIEDGHIYGFLGPNGAGKSTTMNIITGCLSATEGEVKVNGYDIFEEPYKAKATIGYLPEIPPLYTDMTPYEYLMFVAEAKGVSANQRYPQVREVMEITGLEDYSDRLIKNLSKGYKQRVGIAQAMLGDPDIIILDEPTVGLDPKQIIEIRELIKDLGKIKTVILSSHILAEIASVCDHIIIIAHGEIIANDTIENLVSGYSAVSGYRIVIPSTDDSTLNDLLDRLDEVSKTECTYTKDGSETVITIRTSDGVDLREQIYDAISGLDLKILELTRLATSLEDVFLKLTAEDVTIPVDEDEEDADAPDEDEDENEPEEDEDDDNDDDYKPLFGLVREEDDD